ncbi:hypothetical protein PCANC_05105 [Puccinia coronata f. sp. avenae]|uniref:Uncharacterized protein n=1 Tax=Puccinia coronata f. sp. avenae TaxID=200324 RepID=A0A2N5W360_9BASI|nr:hypothetical protein PCANC_05105 [Puccinia coronata f. sp. avenae]
MVPRTLPKRLRERLRTNVSSRLSEGVLTTLRRCPHNAFSWKASGGRGQFLENRPVVHLASEGCLFN